MSAPLASSEWKTQGMSHHVQTLPLKQINVTAKAWLGSLRNIARHIFKVGKSTALPRNGNEYAVSNNMFVNQTIVKTVCPSFS